MRGALIVVAGGARLAISLADVSRIVVENGTIAVPFAHRALAGVMRVPELDGATVPVFDLRGFLAPERPAPRADGMNVAVIPTVRGPVGLRLERLCGTASAYVSVDVDADAFAALPAALRASLAGAGRAESDQLTVGADPFFFFSPEAFINELGLANG